MDSIRRDTRRSRCGTPLEQNRRLWEEGVALGGTAYPIGAVPMSSGDWARHYGFAWEPLQAARRRYDPDGVFGRGPVAWADA